MTKGEIEALIARLDAASSFLSDGVGRRVCADALAYITELECRLADALALTRVQNSNGLDVAAERISLDDSFASPTLDDLSVISQRATAGPWIPPHFTDPTITCNCKYVFGDQGFMGSIAAVDFNDGRSFEDGGGDDPPMDEAIANALLIVGSVNYVRNLLYGAGGPSPSTANAATQHDIPTQPVKILPDTEHDGGEV